MKNSYILMNKSHNCHISFESSSLVNWHLLAVSNEEQSIHGCENGIFKMIQAGTARSRTMKLVIMNKNSIETSSVFEAPASRVKVHSK